MQQINLYSEVLKQQQQQSGIKLMAVATAGVILSFLLFSASAWWTIRTIETQVQQAKSELSQLEAKVNNLSAQRPKNEVNPQLNVEIGEWQSNVNVANEALQMLTGQGTLLLTGFSSYLTAFAIEPNPKVWLTAIHIKAQDKEIRLEGSTFEPHQIPQTLQRLQNKPALNGLLFANLVMQASATKTGQMDFTLSSTEPVKGEKNAAQ